MKPILWVFLTLFPFFLFAWDWNFSPFYSSESFGNETEYTRFLGPIGEIQKRKDLRFYSIHPVWSYTERDTELGESSSFDFLWPFCFRRQSWFGGTSFYFLYYHSDTAGGRRMDYVIPFWFSHREADGLFSWAFFPFYGDMTHFLTYDRLRFVLFPFYWHAVKGTVEGSGWLWPLVNYDAGPHLERYRVFPFYSYAEYLGKRRNRSILWPFFNQQKSLVPNCPGGGTLVWPFWGMSRLGDSRAYSVLWPIFSYTWNEKQKDSFQVNAPYPVFRWGENQQIKGEYIFFLWPLYGEKRTPHMKYSFLLWPILWNLENDSGERIAVHTWIFPFYWSKSVFSGNYSEKLEETKDFWPLVSLKKKGERFELQSLHLAPKGFRTLDRNITPLWTLYRFESKADSWRSDFLWGTFLLSSYPDTFAVALHPFYSFRETKNIREQYFLFHLLKIRSSAEEVRIRILYFLEFRIF